MYIHVANPEQFASFISLLIQQGLSYEKLIELVEEGSLKFFNSVFIMPFMGFGRNDMVSSLWQIQEEAMNQPNYFAKKYLEFEGLKDSFSVFNNFNERYFNKFCDVADKNSVFYRSEDLSSNIIDNAYEDFLNPERNKLMVENLLKEIFKTNRLRKMPEINVRINEVINNYHQVGKNLDSNVVGRNFGNGDYKIYEVEYNKSLMNSLKELENTKTPLLKAISTLPLSCAGYSNLIINSANKLNCDLVLPNPISKIIGDKIYEIAEFEEKQRNLKIGEIIEQFEEKVEFPDIRHYVNEGKVEFDKVLEIRKKAKKFREWLQKESERDRDAIIAYHNEVAKDTGFSKIRSRSLSIFGVLASGAVVGSVSVLTKHLSEDNTISAVAGLASLTITSEVTKKVSTKITEKLFDYGANIGSDWKPIVFGKWLQSDIARLLEKQISD